MSTHEQPTGEPTSEQTGQTGPAPQRPTGWHPVNTGHLVMGVAFVGLVVAWALLTSGTVDVEDHGWVMGLPWLLAGAIGLVATVLRGPRRHWSHDHWKHHHWRQDDQGSGSMHGWH
ncbi:MAG TPA: hypothetical protein VNS46_04720 [Nocardioides sp.]|nr:hypothetical protein [Nocardioides sp.]